MMEHHRREGKLGWKEADSLARQEGEEARLADRALNGDPEQITWWTLTGLVDTQPELAQRAWDRIKAFARKDLLSGKLAADAVIPPAGADKPYDRARFGAIRDSLSMAWAPLNPMEQALVDIMAQSLSQWHFWLARLTLRSTLAAIQEDHDAGQDHRWVPPTISQSEAIEQALVNAERFSQVFIRTVRAMRDLRRFGSERMTINAGQVNIGQQQLNASASPGPSGLSQGPSNTAEE